MPINSNREPECPINSSGGSSQSECRDSGGPVGPDGQRPIGQAELVEMAKPCGPVGPN